MNDRLSRLPGVPYFQPRGVFRGTRAFFDAMEAEKEGKPRAWFQEHVNPMVVE